MATIKICPPLVISDAALLESIETIGEAIEPVLEPIELLDLDR